MMNQNTINRLLYAGWHHNRKININSIKQKYNQIGLEMPNNVEQFLIEFGMIKIDASDKKYYDVDFNPFKAIGDYFDGDYFRECLIEYGVNDMVYPIGEARQSNLIVLMTEQNVFYCFTDGCLVKVGDCIEDMIDCLVGECRKEEIILN